MFVDVGKNPGVLHCIHLSALKYIYLCSLSFVRHVTPNDLFNYTLKIDKVLYAFMQIKKVYSIETLRMPQGSHVTHL